MEYTIVFENEMCATDLFMKRDSCQVKLKILIIIIIVTSK